MKPKIMLLPIGTVNRDAGRNWLSEFARVDLVASPRHHAGAVNVRWKRIASDLSFAKMITELA
ncbi:hypothetical protein ACHFJ0_09735 [Paracoccus sp. NGMCC 1.201697]|uniref:Uncharacterized protein n=1 Tax=Paracoccus broussonetiae subsp. drimophilus TaxID=3373869 RepID=A0ABW7LNQ3_9RHOB